ncbi:type II toxin-antitoxin system VapC family toxin [Amycolatopsis benzoatilytica]|uniref:type II toxin-antitoxin system VapC family toxin n=1 Tax=Amycolatopsis benzoatilytica TaxID=346045 RepID=UPI0003794A35|nr:type II toxin-antitoxin system VapC family toxin [Amycolatopsis benzoatilytica]
MTSPSRVLLDTSVVIDLERLDLGTYASAVPVISSVTLAELAYGLATEDPIQLSERVERYHAALQYFPVLPFGVSEAKMYGTAAALVRRFGRNPRPRRLDLQLAATAAVHRIPLLTRNAKDFAGLDRLLTVVDV